jgi:hypothetical protein
MSDFRIALAGYNAETDTVDKMSIDSNYQTQITAFSDNTSGSVTSGIGVTTFNLGSSLGFVPSALCIAKPASKIGSSNGLYPVPDSAYQLMAPPSPGSNAYGLLDGDPWVLGCQRASSYTVDYIYSIYYLPSQVTSSSASNPPSNTAPYINVAKTGGNALTDSLQKLAWSSQSKTLQVLSHQTFTVTGNLDANNSLNSTFTSGISYPALFTGTGTDNSTGYTYPLDYLARGTFNFGVDSSTFYANYWNGSLAVGTAIYYTLSVYFLIP